MDDSLLNELRRRKALRFDDPVAPADLVEGVVSKVVGVVRAADEALRAPFTGRECVAFTVRVLVGRDELVYRRGEEELSQDFWLDAEGGSVWIRPKGWCRYLVGSTLVARDDSGAWAAYESFAARHGAHWRETFANFADGLAYHERVVPVGARVAIVGRVGEPHQPLASELRGGYRTRVLAPALEPPPDGRLWISTSSAHT